jgi:hypothetical protein
VAQCPKPMKERPDPNAHSREPLHPSSLPPELAQFLQGQEYACITYPTDQGTVFVVKAPRRDIESARGTVPIHLRHELYEHPSAPVVRMVTTIYDQPTNPLKLETFFNVGDPEQRSDYAALSGQEHVHFLFYDEALTHRLTKAVGNLDHQALADVLSRADALAAAIPTDRFDFDHAKAEVLGATSL